MSTYLLVQYDNTFIYAPRNSFKNGKKIKYRF